MLIEYAVSGDVVLGVCSLIYVLSSSPFEVQVGPEAGAQKVRAWGPGLETGVVGKSADFVVEAIGTEVGTLGKCCRFLRYWRGFPFKVNTGLKPMYLLHFLPVQSAFN